MSKDKKTDLKDLLKKRIVDLTDKEIESLETRIGTSGRPFPMYGTITVEEDGHVEREHALTVVADDEHPMVLYSERPYAEVIGLAYRQMPVPGMLPVFFDAMERRRLTNKGRLQFIKGDPGAGKSFMGAMFGRMRSKDPVEVLDCGGKNMRELLFETVLDFGAGDALPKAVDARIQAGTLEDLSLGLLKQLGALKDDKDESGASFVKELPNDKLAIDWYGLAHSGKENVKEAYAVLSKVSKIEGLDNAGSNSLGMNSQYGPAILSFINGTELVLDEYNKSKEGTDDNLQTFLQFATGEIDECVVENPLKNKDSANGVSHFVFRREDIKAGWFLTLTGNASEDGLTTRPLNKSVYSRLDPQILAKPSEMDWQHRICQIMTGLPISTIYATFKEQADKDPEKFAEDLKFLRIAGLTETEVANIPEFEMTMIQNWQSVVDATKKLAKFYSGWQHMTDAEMVADRYADLLDEVDEEYSNELSIDFRKIIKHIEEAMPIRAKMKPVNEGVSFDSMSDWNEAPKAVKIVEEDLALEFGTRLTDLLERKVYETSGAIGKENLYKKLQQLMENSGLRDVYLQEATRSQQKTVEKLLNVSMFNNADPSKQAELTQHMLCDYLRERFPDLTDDNEQIVTSVEIQRILREHKENVVSETHDVKVPNSNIETLTSNPFSLAEVFDAISLKNGAELPFYLDDVIEHDDFMTSLAIPVVGEKNIEALWNENLSNFLEEQDKKSQVAAPEQDNEQAAENKPADDVTPKAPVFNNTVTVDESVNIAEGKSQTGIQTTTVYVIKPTEEKDEDGYPILEEIPVHIVQNKNRNKTLIVSDGVNPRLESLFKQAGIEHVNRNDSGAKSKTDTALNELLRGTSDEVKDRLDGAFSFRNEDVVGLSLPERMTIKNREQSAQVHKKYIVLKGVKP